MHYHLHVIPMVAAAITLAISHRTDHQLSKCTLALDFLITLTIEVLLWLLYTTLIYPHYVSPLRHLPTPPGASLFMGHSKRISKESTGEPQLHWIQTVPNAGIIRYLHWFNAERVLLTSPEALAEVLVTKAYDFKKPALSRNVLVRLLGEGILTAEGDEHKRQRKGLTPAFAFRHVKEVYPIFWAKAKELTRTVLGEITSTKSDAVAAGTSQFIDIQPWMSRATLDVIGVAGMGQDFGAIQDSKSPLTLLYKKMFDVPTYIRLLQFFQSFLPIWLMNNLPIKRNQEIAQVKREIRQVCLDLIDAKRRKLKDKDVTERDILSVAIESAGFNDEELVNNVMTFLLAGHGTTSVSMTWALYYLSKNPHAQEKLRREVMWLKHRDADEITSTDIDSCQYLKAVCNEVLRVRPPVPLTPRTADQDVTILGQLIPRGTRVILCPQAINNDPGLWGADAGDFKPERWMNEAGQADNRGGTSSNHAFLTFLHGPRNCIGMSFARAEFACLLAAWVCAFRTELKDPEQELDIVSQVVQQPRHGIIHNNESSTKRASGGSPLIIYLRSGLVISSHHDTYAALLSRRAASTVVEIEYRLSGTHHKFPTPLHDILFGYDWIAKNLVRQQDTDVEGAQHARLGVVGHHVGGGLATMLALTECTPWKPHIAAAALIDPIVDWTDLTMESPASCTTRTKRSTAQGEAGSDDGESSLWLVRQLLAKRAGAFSRPAGYFDPFASPLLFFRHAGRDTPLPSRDSLLTTHDDFAELTSVVEPGADTDTNTGAGARQETKVRKSSKRYPPNGSGLVLPCFRFGVSSGGGLRGQIDECATRIRKSILRDCGENEDADRRGEEQVQVLVTGGPRDKGSVSADFDGDLARWLRDTL